MLQKTKKKKMLVELGVSRGARDQKIVSEAKDKML